MLFISLFFFTHSFATAINTEVVERIVVVIEEKPITQTDIELERELALLLPSSSKTMQYYREKDPQESLIQRQLLRKNAGDINLYKADISLIEQRFDQFRSQWTEIDAYQHFMLRHGITSEQLLTIIRAQIIAENYLQKNIGIDPQTDPIITQSRFESWLDTAKEQTKIRMIVSQYE